MQKISHSNVSHAKTNATGNPESTTTTNIVIGPSESADASWNGMSGGTVRALVTDDDP